jgi:hypothetical protein
MGIIDSIIGAESGGDPNARNPNSSATGAGQFISSTWLDTIKTARPDLAEGKSDQELLALRTDPALSREMTEAYAARNGETLAKAGHPVTPGTTYLAHFAGPQGAVAVLGADPNAPVSSVLGRREVEANPFLQKMTVGDLRAWADRKMGGAPAAPQAAPAPAMTPSNPVASAIMGAPQAPQAPIPQTAGDLASQLMGTPRQGQPGGPLDVQPMESAPIQFAKRRAPDLSKLRALFQPPNFSRG